jgi:hypothetical protein
MRNNRLKMLQLPGMAGVLFCCHSEVAIEFETPMGWSK